MLRLHISDAALQAGTIVEIPTAQLAHVRARRVEFGQTVCVFNGNGIDAFGVLQPMGKKGAQVEICSVRDGLAFSQPTLTIALSIIAADRMDWAIQKCAELGVAQFVPLLAERSQAAGQASRKLNHWAGVAVSAAEQCGRARIMTVAAPVDVGAWVAQSMDARRAVCDGDAQRGLHALLGTSSVLSGTSIQVAVGPEGGWSPAERILFVEHKIPLVKLGQATLRAETAAVSVAASLQSL